MVRAPDHLGDAVMAEPAVRLLASCGATLDLVGPRFCADLYAHLGVRTYPQKAAFSRARGAALAVLLKPSFSAALRALPARRRVGLPTDHRRLLLSRVVEERNAEHRADGFLRVAAAALGQQPQGPALPAIPVERPGPLPPSAAPILLLPGTRSAATVAWRGMGALVRALLSENLPVLATGGPGDEEALAELAALGAPVLAPLPLPDFAALCLQAKAIVGPDSGLPHLAAAARRAAGLDVGAVHVVHASTDPARTGPPGSRAWAGPRPHCWPCYAKRCAIGAPCRDADPTDLLPALR